MVRLTLALLLVAMLCAVAAVAQDQPPPPPGGPGNMPGGGGGMEGAGPGMRGMPGMMPPGMNPMMSQTPVMLLAPDKYLYVIYAGTLFQFDANSLELLKQVPLAPAAGMWMRGGPGGGMMGGPGMAPGGAPVGPPQNT